MGHFSRSRFRTPSRHYSWHFAIAERYDKLPKAIRPRWNHYEQIIPALKIDAQPAQINARSCRSHQSHGSKMHARSDYCGGPDQPDHPFRVARSSGFRLFDPFTYFRTSKTFTTAFEMRASVGVAKKVPSNREFISAVLRFFGNGKN
jgi:hypothetical protein